MKVLLVYPTFPRSYWGFQYALDMAGFKSSMPPLGLITVAALCPADWSLRLLDMNVETLKAADLKWADLVMISGMVVQRESMQRVLRWCRELGVRTVVGGPYATACPQELEEADHLVLDEAELTLPMFLADLAAQCPQRVYTTTDKPDVTGTPIPRFDLLKLDAYSEMCLQYSRGCPFNCEFCDIITLYGRRPRTKTAAQMLAEMQALYDRGWRGGLFLVDDNFIGNKKNVKLFLPELVQWMEARDKPFMLFTEASVNLAEDAELLDLMVKAGFVNVFMGIETPSMEGLKETQKTQNMRGDLLESVHKVQKAGMQVMGGFIVGFDSDTEDIFQRQIDFIEQSNIAAAMVVMLSVMPKTQLWDRLEKEGRLVPYWSGDMFGIPNFATRLPTRTLVAGHRRILAELYEPGRFYDRLYRTIDTVDTPTNILIGGLTWKMRLHFAGVVLRVLWRQSTGPEAGHFWRLILKVLKNHPQKLHMAVKCSTMGHHFIRYTQDEVLPRLDDTLRKLETQTPAGPGVN